MAIDVGADAIFRDTRKLAGNTIIDKNNPANASGKIKTVEIWLRADGYDGIVGTFYTTNGDTLKCRDSVAIGDVDCGSKQTISGLSISIEAGDYIGVYFPSFGQIEQDKSGYAGIWVKLGKYIDPDDEADFSFLADDAISLYGTGEEAAGDNGGDMATTHKKRPDGDPTNWSWENAERAIAFHHDIAGGEASDFVANIAAGAMAQDIHIDKVVVSLENAPGSEKTVTVTCGNGTSTITATVTGTDVGGSSTTNHFDFDVSAETVTIAISATAGVAAGCVTIFIFYHDITITA